MVQELVLLWLLRLLLRIEAWDLLLLLLYSRRDGNSLDPSALVDGLVKILAWGMHHTG